MPVLESLSKGAVVQRSPVKKVLLKISQNSQENTREFCKFSKHTFSYRAPLVAASVSNTVKCLQTVWLATLLKRDTSTGV